MGTKERSWIPKREREVFNGNGNPETSVLLFGGVSKRKLLPRKAKEKKKRPERGRVLKGVC